MYQMTYRYEDTDPRYRGHAPIVVDTVEVSCKMEANVIASELGARLRAFRILSVSRLATDLSVEVADEQ